MNHARSILRVSLLLVVIVCHSLAYIYRSRVEQFFLPVFFQVAESSERQTDKNRIFGELENKHIL